MQLPNIFVALTNNLVAMLWESEVNKDEVQVETNKAEPCPINLQ